MSTVFEPIQSTLYSRSDFTQGNVPSLRAFMAKIIRHTNAVFNTGNSNWIDDDGLSVGDLRGNIMIHGPGSTYVPESTSLAMV